MIPKPSGKRFDVTIAGEINLDLILYGLPAEMPLERELLASSFQLTLGGSSAIVAHNLASLGQRVGFVTRLGTDDLGRIALERLGRSGVDLSQVHAAETPATGITVVLPHNSGRHMFTCLGAIAELKSEDLPLDYLADTRHFHLSSLFLQRALHPGLASVLLSLKDEGVTISLDTNDDPGNAWGGILDEILPLVDVFMPNEDELLRMTRQTTLEAALALMGPRVPLIVVKRGSRGALLHEHGISREVPGLSVTPVDTVGAGDSFDAGFLSAWLRGLSPFEAARAGNITGALSTQAPGGTEAFRDQALREAFLATHGFFSSSREHV